MPVQQTSAFELDGNAIHGNGSSATPAEPNGHDWDQVFQQFNTNKLQNPGSIDGASARDFLTDPFTPASDDIYTGGGTKDGLPINGWRWTSGNPQAKDDLEHAYAAEYQGVSECVSGSCANHQLLFFGTDRYSNSGNSDVGFWFLKNQVGKQSGGTFSGNHANKDVLVVSTFQNGGVVPQIAVYEWLCTGTGAACDSSGTLTLIGSSNGADCVNGVDTHNNPVPASTGPFCATVNTANGVPTGGWTYTEKSSDGSYVAANKFGAGTFFEGGIDLTALDLDNQCFSSYIAESRASQSVTSTLSDFTSGSFAVCTANMTTTPAAAGGASLGSLNPGTSVTDTASVTGGGLSNPPTPTGTVSFTICGPDSATTCTSAGSGTLSGTGATATAQSSAVSENTPGTYCFHASWPGDTNYTAPLTESNSSAECFTVVQLPTTTVTTPWSGSSASAGALSSPLTIGNTQAFDQAVVTGTTAGGTPTGTVTFFICDPTQVTGASGAEVCASGAGTQVGQPQTTPASTTGSTSTWFSSPAIDANKAGVWCFRATYVPDSQAGKGADYLPAGSNDSTHDECFTVNPASTTTVTTPHDATNPTPTFALTASGLDVNDSALVTGVNDGGTPTGTVDFYLCGPGATGSCSATSGTKFDTQTLAGVANSSPPQASATSKNTHLTQTGQYCFFAQYNATPGGNYTGSSDGSQTECFTVSDATATSTAQSWVPNDSARISSTGGSALNGTLTFSLYPDNDCGKNEPQDSLLFSQQFTLSNTASPATRSTDTSQPAGSNGVLLALGGPVVAPGASVSWGVAFASSDPNIASSNTCEQSVVTINN